MGKLEQMGRLGRLGRLRDRQVVGVPHQSDMLVRVGMLVWVDILVQVNTLMQVDMLTQVDMLGGMVTCQVLERVLVLLCKLDVQGNVDCGVDDDGLESEVCVGGALQTELTFLYGEHFEPCDAGC